MSSASQPNPEVYIVDKLSWPQAIRRFFSSKEEVGLFVRLMALVSALGIVDLPIDAIPGVDFFTLGADVISWPFGVYAIVRIVMIKNKGVKFRKPKKR